MHKQPFIAGEVALIGAGPGDPELLTVKAHRLITNAEIVIYDRLVSQEIMDLLPQGCEKIYVGKKQAQHHLPQDKINQLLVDHAKKGKKVVRLKGGDPFVFGRGGEEAQYLLQHGVACHIVPGLTAASACTSYAGIPLTHRQVAQSCTLITGNVQNNGKLDLPWEMLANKMQTVIFYMGITRLDIISAQLIAAGRNSATPAAIIYRGTQPEQQVYRGQLTALTQLVEQHKIKPPALVVVGDVVETFDADKLKNIGYLAP